MKSHFPLSEARFPKTDPRGRVDETFDYQLLNSQRMRGLATRQPPIVFNSNLVENVSSRLASAGILMFANTLVVGFG